MHSYLCVAYFFIVALISNVMPFQSLAIDISNAFIEPVQRNEIVSDTSENLGIQINNLESSAIEPRINEFSASTVGTDVEYIEIFGQPDTDYTSYTVLEIEGDESGCGTIDEVIELGTTDANGYYLASLPANSLENGTLSLLLVKNFTGSIGDDLDPDDNAPLDVTPWTEIVDAIYVHDGGAGDVVYGGPTLYPNYDGLSSTCPGGASRIPNGFDSDHMLDWVRNDFDLAGIPGYSGTIIVGEAYNTPGAKNKKNPLILFVNSKVQGTGNGLSWENAYPYLQDALAASVSGNEIWVVAGVYSPDESNLSPAGTGDRKATFQLKIGVALYGGFSGGETDRTQRDFQKNMTTLSGDLSGDDGADFINYEENSYHVVTGSGTDGTARLDGFIVCNGNGDAEYPGSGGGGFYNNGHADYGGQASPTIINCTFINNKGYERGGAMLNHDNANPGVVNCRFLGNYSRYGGAIYNGYYSSVNRTVTNCLFSGNTATDLGGAIRNVYYSDPRFINCTFAFNTAGDKGGAVQSWGGSHPVFHNCILYDNSASEGAQLAIESGTMTVSYSDVQEGSAGVYLLDATLNWGSGNIEAPPGFLDFHGPDKQAGTLDDSPALKIMSPCIDAGDNTLMDIDGLDLDEDGNLSETIPFDLFWQPRLVDTPHVVDTGSGVSPIVDMGVFENFRKMAMPWIPLLLLD